LLSGKGKKLPAKNQKGQFDVLMKKKDSLMGLLSKICAFFIS
jgi:hypothetical protein